MFAKLASIAGVGSSLPFTADADAAYETSWGGWSHMPGTLREDGSAVSIFKKSAPKGDKKLDTARNGVKRLRMMRHPNVLSFKTSIEVEERSEIVVYIVTEPVKPLLQVMTDLNLEGMQRDQYLTMGLYHVASAVSFLSNDVDLVHGNICLAAIVVTPTLDWKLHGLDLMTEHAMPERPPPLAAASFLVGAQYLPGEVGKSDWDAISQGPPWAVDAWGMGCLMQEVYSCKVLAQIEQLRNTECIPEGLRQDYQRLLSSQPTRRLNPAKLVSESGFLKNTLVKTVVFLENLSVKDSAEKDQFFRKLPNLLPSFPQSLCVQKFLPLLQNALEYGGAPPIALSAVLKIGNTLEPEEFQGRVIPIVTKLFTSQERAIRKSLLENISLFGPHLTEKVCEDQIFPEVVKGFTDTNDYLRELTLRSMLTLAPKLTQRTLNNSLLKYLAKLQVDETPGIRANTTVLLGNIAPYLGEAACKRVLLNAFTRALKDQFPPARIAALKALMATSDRHSAEEAAQRIMPSVMPFFVDPIKDVRKAAVQCSDAYIKILKKNAGAMDKRDDEAAEKAAADAAAGGPASAPVPAAQGPQAIKRQDSGKSGYLSWAVSLMSTTGSSAKAAPPPPETERDTGQASASEGAAAQSKTAVDPEPSQAADTRKEVLDTALGAAPGDGWGDDDELLGLEEQEDEAEVQARLRMERLKQKLGSLKRAGERTARRRA
uniref:SCY1-like protein 1 n=1 Tax=Tetraselmis sp. GSL018 TaxID=582737 RepID=A0A061S498_9CHLO